jgi:hypothetical protein
LIANSATSSSVGDRIGFAISASSWLNAAFSLRAYVSRSCSVDTTVSDRSPSAMNSTKPRSTGTIVVHKKLDAGRFELPRATQPGEQHLLVSASIFEVIHKGVAIMPRASRRQFH